MKRVNRRAVITDLAKLPEPHQRLVRQQRDEFLSKLPRNVLRGLSDSARTDLWHVVAEYDQRLQSSRYEVDAVARRGEDAQCRKLHRKVLKLASALDDTLTYVSKLAAPTSLNWRLAHFVSQSVAEPLRDAHATIRAVTLNTERATDPRHAAATERKPVAEATDALVSLFTRHGRAPADAAARTAIIGNTLLWWDKVKSRAVKRDSDLPQGSDAVRKRLARLKKSRPQPSTRR